MPVGLRGELMAAEVASGETRQEGLSQWHRFILSASMFLCVSAFGFLEPFVPLYLELSGLSRGQIGLVVGVGAGLALLVQPLLGRLSDRIDKRRPLMVVGALLTAAAYLSYRGADHLVLFVLLTALGVNGISYLNTANAVLVSRLALAHGGSRGATATFASFRVWGSVGYVVVSLLTGLLVTRGLAGQSPTREGLDPLFTYAPLVFVLVAGVAMLLPDPRRSELPVPPPDKQSKRAVSGEPKADSTAAPHRGGQQNLRWFLFAYFLYCFAWNGSASFLSLHLRALGATPAWMTAVYATGVLCEILVMSQVSRWCDEFGRRPLLAVALAAMPLRLLLYVPAPHPLWILCVQTLHGINFGVLVTVTVAFVNDVCTEETRGAAQSRLAATSGLAAAFGPAVGGWLASAVGIPATFLVMAGVAGVGAGWFLWKVRETHPDPVRLHRQGPMVLRPLFRVLCIPGVCLARLPRVRRSKAAFDARAEK